MTTLLRFTSGIKGRLAGTDRFGNRYYESRRKTDSLGRHVRWVLFAGKAEASAVPPEWWGWIHYTTTDPLPEDAPRKPWQKEHRPNLTGTAESYRPPGHDHSGGQRAASSGDYEAWTPGSAAPR
jgi:NADH:ubiquinone oxidoreductase subunit